MKDETKFESVLAEYGYGKIAFALRKLNMKFFLKVDSRRNFNLHSSLNDYEISFLAQMGEPIFHPKRIC